MSFGFIDLNKGERTVTAEGEGNFVNLKFYCKERLLAWQKLGNLAKYLACEYEQKEREYGIAWRTEFKAAAKTILTELKAKAFGAA